MKTTRFSMAVLCSMLLYGGTTSDGGIFFTEAQAAGQKEIQQVFVQRATAVVDANVKTAVNKKGVFTCATLGEALQQIAKEKASSAIILLHPGVYREKVIIEQPNLTLLGTGKNAAATTIVFNNAEGTPVGAGDVQSEGENTYVMDCATVMVTDKARNFQAQNLTFANDFATEKARAEGRMKSVQAFAIRDEADQSSFWKCRFIGRQDTLYANVGRQYYKDCYIEGDIDFIFGGAAAVFDNCEVRSLDKYGKNKGYVTAPSTLEQDKGYLFYHCHLTSDFQFPDKGMLGRPWHPSSEKRLVNSAATFRECQIDTPIGEKAWDSMANK
ncbi:MAG: pectinesterase family protein [Selenomonadaceae bacterium]